MSQPVEDGKDKWFSVPHTAGKDGRHMEFCSVTGGCKKKLFWSKKQHWCSVWWFFSEKNSDLCHYKDIKGGRRCLQHQRLRQRSHKEDDQFGRRFRHQSAERCQGYLRDSCWCLWCVYGHHFQNSNLRPWPLSKIGKGSQRTSSSRECELCSHFIAAIHWHSMTWLDKTGMM